MRTRSGIYQNKRYDVNNGISVVNLCEGHFIRPMALPPPPPPPPPPPFFLGKVCFYKYKKKGFAVKKGSPFFIFFKGIFFGQWGPPPPLPDK